MRFFSLFAGVGGFDEGIKRAIPEAECVGLSEIDKYANQVLKYHYKEVKNYGDITKINPTELPDFDILCGGFPCQSFSLAGNRGGFNDTRGTLFLKLRALLKSRNQKYYSLRKSKGYSLMRKGERLLLSSKLWIEL